MGGEAPGLNMKQAKPVPYSPGYFPVKRTAYSRADN